MENKTENNSGRTAGVRPSDKDKSIKRSIWSYTWLHVLIMGILTAVVFSQFIFSDGMLESSDQLSGIDSKVLLKNTLHTEHQFPMWFSSRLSGMPTCDALFGDMLYLPSVVMNYVLQIHRAISWRMIFHVFLAGVFFFVMMRKGFSASPLVALTGALFYMFNPQFFSHIYPGHDGKMFVIAWLPYIIWRLKRMFEVVSFRNCALLALGIGMCILTSHIQMTYFVLWGIFFYYLLAVVFMFIKKEPIAKPAKISLYFWMSVIIGLGIGLVQLFPSMMYIRDAFSVRGVDRGLEFASSWSLHWPEAISMAIPEFVNTLEYYWGQNPFKLNSEYAGSIVLLLAILAVVRNPNRWRIFWISVAAFALLFSLGKHTPVFYLVYYVIPGVKKFRACSMIMFWFSFSTVILATLFVKDLLMSKLSDLDTKLYSRWNKGLLISIGATFVLAVVMSNKGLLSGLFPAELSSTQKIQVFDANFSRNFVPCLWLWFFITGTALASVWMVVTKRMKPALAVTILLCIGMFDVLRVDVKFIKMMDPRNYFYEEPAIVQLKDKMKEEPFRCYSLPGALPNNGEGIHGLEGINGFHDNELRWYREFRGDQSDRNFIMSLLGFNENGQAYLNAEKLSVGNPFLDIANAKYMLVRAEDGLHAIENRNALGRVSFVQNFVVIDSARIISALGNGEYDYRTTVALTKEPDVKVPKSETVSGVFAAKWEKYLTNHRKVHLSIPENGYLRISEVFYPGWELLIDGKKIKPYRADIAWMAIPVTQGEHELELKVHSNYLGKVEWISITLICAYLVYGLCFVSAFVIRRKSQTAAVSKKQ